MIPFECDYNNGAHPKVLKHLMETNGKPSLTYGFDEWSDRAKDKIREACEAPDAQIYFLCGGTQTNATVIDGMLRSYQAVITADTGHINIHEAGAIEASGHKVIALPSHHGKMAAKDLEAYMEWFVHDESAEHLAQPGMVYLTFPTEYGTVYSAAEIAEIYSLCHQYELSLFIDGARLGYGLQAKSTDITLPFLAGHCDVFYIGGTKIGALCGEAVVFPYHNAPRHFFSIIKRHGALMAKGRLTGVQFDALFTDNLYFEISRHAIDMAEKLKKMFKKKGFRFLLDSPTNQQFVVLDNKTAGLLENHVGFTRWEPADKNHTVCRFATSWSTTEKDLKQLRGILDGLLPKTSPKKK
ncbi:MAG: aminotransferase class V-fold PLP-dependent enzyme [Prevotellaceae bacterium]|nr:aminotransferase class V-fold PLP-dependent enzyme [Prevotella sp.]MDD7258481.1 aminotransferase class V-fold PLP-dependent enzyme [Prevotellaceae bacterium]